MKKTWLACVTFYELMGGLKLNNEKNNNDNAREEEEK